MQVLSNHKTPITLAGVPHPTEKGKLLHARLRLEPGLNEPDPTHWEACCKAANTAWLGAMFEPGAMRADGKATLEVLSEDGPAAKRRPAKDMVKLIKSAKSAAQLAVLENEEGEEPRQSVTDALEKRMGELGD